MSAWNKEGRLFRSCKASMKELKNLCSYYKDHKRKINATSS